MLRLDSCKELVGRHLEVHDSVQVVDIVTDSAAGIAGIQNLTTSELPDAVLVPVVEPEWLAS